MMRRIPALLRGILFNIYLLLLTITMGVVALPIRLLNRRMLALNYAKLWSRAVLWGLTRLCAIQIDIRGKDNLPRGPLLIASQHQSFFDGFVWMNTVDLPAYIIKKELISIPFVGPMLLLSGMIPVDRKGGSQALRDMMDATATAQRSGRQIIIFPEGTRTRPGERVTVQNGVIAVARQAKVPIIPVATNSGLFWPHSPWLKYPGTIIIAIGSAITPGKGRELIASLEQTWDRLCHENNLPRDSVIRPVDKSVDDSGASR